MEIKDFKSLLEFQQYFDTNDKCREYLEQLRWNGKPICPYCGSEKIHRLKVRRLKCGNRACLRNFSVTVGTVFENTKLPLVKWFIAMYLVINHSKGISSLQLSKFLGITQKSAWFVLHRIRELLTDKEPVMLKGTVEADETFVGGKNINRHVKNRVSDGSDKTTVLGILERNGKVKTIMLTNASPIGAIPAQEIHPHIIKHVQAGSLLLSDNATSYKGLHLIYQHEAVAHSRGEYVRGEYHINTLEGFWSLLKRGIIGIYHQVSRKHLHRYCNEYSFRYNEREHLQDGRFAIALTQTQGRLKYKDLIKKAS